MCILELSKVLIYKFHYDYIKNKYDNKSKTIIHRHCSLMHEIKTEDVYEDFSSNEEFFFSINIIVKHSNLRTTVTRHQNSKMSGNK